MNEVEIPENILNNPNLLVFDLRYHKTLKAAAQTIGVTPSAITQKVSKGDLNMYEVPELSLKFVDIRELGSVPTREIPVPAKLFMMNSGQVGKVVTRLIVNYNDQHQIDETNLKNITQQNQERESKNQELTTQLSDAQAEIERLKNRLAESELVINELTDIKDKAFEEAEKLTGQAEKLTGQLEEANNGLVELSQKLEAEKAVVANLKHENFALKNENSVLLNEKKYLKSQVVDLKSDKESLQKRLDNQDKIEDLLKLFAPKKKNSSTE